jgi:hypothetical protein
MRDGRRRLLAVAGAVVLQAGFAAGASAQISPGPLSRAHADLEGVTNCLKCHGIGQRTVDTKCLDCHREIGALRDQKRGLHGLAAGKGCNDCHREHGGLDLEMIHWDEGSPEKFDHRRAGWPLDGKHAQTECRKCHTPKLHAVTFPAGAVWNGAAESWLGLDTQCRACHQDPHQGRLGNACASCHDESDWHDITEQRFDHETTRYPLRGAHVDVKCEKCHPRVDGKMQMPKFARCDDCHEDPHAGQIVVAGVARDCADCHSIRFFKPSTLGLAYHATTKYPLDGKHAKVDCAKCHRNEDKRFGKSAFEFRPASAHCTDCHEDAHAGQLAKRADGGACESCHTVAHFAPSTFAAADHARTKFPLEARHAEVKCAACHGPVRPGLPALPGPGKLGKAGVEMKPDAAECDACHLDPHHGRFSKGGQQPVKGGCSTCHDARSFHRVALDAKLHAQLGFPLDGAHAAVVCFDCHKELRGERFGKSSLLLLAPASVNLAFTAPKTCRECHEDVHGGQFAKRKKGDACDACHGVDAFRPATRFDHDRDSAFPLKGAHERVACQGCHPVRKLPDGRQGAVYVPTPAKCENCHTVPPPPLEAGKR